MNLIGNAAYGFLNVAKEFAGMIYSCKAHAASIACYEEGFDRG
jgi:hypothetical protein